jgi:hypothetical protein
MSFLKALRPAARSVMYAQYLNDISLQPIGNNEGRLGDDQLTCAGDAARVDQSLAIARMSLINMNRWRGSVLDGMNPKCR